MAAIAALVMTTTYLHNASGTISEAVSSVVAAEELQKNLLEYSRDRMMHALKDPQITAELVDESEHRIRHWYSRIELHASNADEERIVDEVQRLVDRYIGTRIREQRDYDPQEVFRNGRQFLDPARAGIQDLVALNQRQAEEARLDIDRQDRSSDRLGVIISVLLVLSIVSLVYGMRIQLYKPLMLLRQAIQEFAHGNLAARTVPQGPLEMREIMRVFNELADSQNQSKENHYRFLAAVAHDLRNPLSALRMSFELVSSAEPGEKREIEAIAKRQIDQLDQMVGDLLDSSRIESGKFSLNFEKRDLRLDIEQAAALHRQVSPAHTLQVRMPEGPVRCEYDSLRMSQVLNNLVNNAIKYSPSGGVIFISLDSNDREALIEVKDQGIGIAADDLIGIFEPFHRSRITRDTIPGVGLGLAVAKRLVEAHGGTLEVESREGEGALFRVRLPRASAGREEFGSNVAYLSATASDLVLRGRRSHASEIPIEQS